MDIYIKKFDELTVGELHDIFQLRSEVFVVEQDCVYQDIDGKDPIALHVLGKKEGKIIAYTRLFNVGDYFSKPSFGRVVVKKEERQFGYGHDLIKASIKAIEDIFKEKEIKISAQKYLVKFYTSHGFEIVGEEYLEDGIPHVGMLRH